MMEGVAFAETWNSTYIKVSRVFVALARTQRRVAPFASGGAVVYENACTEWRGQRTTMCVRVCHVFSFTCNSYTRRTCTLAWMLCS
jgi:hypothetical protein